MGLAVDVADFGLPVLAVFFQDDERGFAIAVVEKLHAQDLALGVAADADGLIGAQQQLFGINRALS